MDNTTVSTAAKTDPAAEKSGSTADRKNKKRLPSRSGPHYRSFADRLRFILMPFMCVLFFGLPTTPGNLLQNICSFAPIAFFIISGFLVLRESRDRSGRILRTIMRSGIAFVVTAVVYFAINFFYYKSAGYDAAAIFSDGKSWFNFLVMNVWQYQIGGGIWFVQSLFYAYIIIFVLEKFNLLRFDWIIFTVLIVISILGGELCGVLKFDIFGYNYFPGNFLTRALPYILLGNFIHRKSDFFCSVPTKWYTIGAVAGAGLCVAEVYLLAVLERQGYYGHLIGMPVIAVCAVMLAIKKDKRFSRLERALIPTSWCNNLIYYLAQPLAFALSLIIIRFKGTEIFEIFTAVEAAVTFLILYGVALICQKIKISRI